jgi:hypothetical protein
MLSLTTSACSPSWRSHVRLAAVKSLGRFSSNGVGAVLSVETTRCRRALESWVRLKNSETLARTTISSPTFGT